DTSAVFAAETVKNSTGWQRRLMLAIAVCVVCLILVAAVQLSAQLNHRPELVFPPEAAATLRLQQSGERPVSPELLDRLVKAMPTCVVGKKYGAVCQDGEVTF